MVTCYVPHDVVCIAKAMCSHLVSEGLEVLFCKALDSSLIGSTLLLGLLDTHLHLILHPVSTVMTHRLIHLQPHSTHLHGPMQMMSMHTVMAGLSGVASMQHGVPEVQQHSSCNVQIIAVLAGSSDQRPAICEM